MNRRRKRKKSKNTTNQDSPVNGNSPLSDEKTPEPAHKTVRESKTIPKEPLPVRKADTKPPAPVDDLADLDDSFEDDPAAATSEKSLSLPSGENKRGARLMRRVEESEPSSNEDAEKGADDVPEPQKKQRLRRTSEKMATRVDELGSLDGDAEALEAQPQPTSEKLPEILPSKPEPTEEPEPTPREEEAPTSLKGIFKNALSSLSLLEQVCIGLLVITLLVAGIWAASVVSARIPNKIIASKLNFPLKGESVVISDLQSYWRSPVREGKDIDEGVSESIELIPVVNLSLGDKSKAKSLRFLFRDEDGRYVGDSTTVTISGSRFLPAEDVTATTKGKSATIRSTTGFEYEGELISYLADENFQWEVVILESVDGKNYTKFMAIPISANRKDKS